jgi:hypothetical protein
MNALAEFSDYEGLRKALNAARDHRKMTLGMMNALVDCPTGYFEKLLGMRTGGLSGGAGRRIGAQSLGWAFGVLGIKCVIVEDPEAWAKIQRMRDFKTRDESHPLPTLQRAAVHVVISRRAHTIISRKGGLASWSKLTPKQRSAKARKMAKARWRKVKARARQRKAAHKARKAAT